MTRSEEMAGQVGGDENVIFHATTVAWGDKAVLIRGQSGQGKSALALSLIAYGCTLVADDQTKVIRRGDVLEVRCPTPGLEGVIEARGIGLLAAPSSTRAELLLIVDLDRQETERLPPHRHDHLLGCRLPLVLGAQNAHLPQAILLWLRGGRLE